MVSLEDDNSKNIAEIMGNKTCKKVLSLLSETEMSEGDIARELKIPLNTAEYNLKKLVSSGLVEKTKSFFWSVKGKKIPVYRLSNKYIVIAPKGSNFSGLKSVLPVLAILGLGAWVVNYFTPHSEIFVERAKDVAYGAALQATASVPEANSVASAVLPAWVYFMVGGVFSLLIYFIVKKVLKGGN